LTQLKKGRCCSDPVLGTLPWWLALSVRAA
jgi:hypothetical protein